MLDTPEDVLTILGPRIYLFAGHLPLTKPCPNCPFTAAAANQDYLAPGRLDGIKIAVLLGQGFPCHETVYQKAVPWEEDDDGNEVKPRWHRAYRQCAGALAWAKAFLQEHGAVALVNGSES